MSNIERRLAKLEAAMNPPSPPDVEWLTITPDMDVEQAAATYRENLRLHKASYVHPAPRDQSEPEMSLEDATAYMQSLNYYPAPTHRSVD